MKNILLIITTLIIAAFLISSLAFIYKYPERFSFSQSKESPFVPLKEYDVSAIKNPDRNYSAPVLPDIAPYNVNALKQSIPMLELGEISVENLDKGYPVLRSQTAQYGDMQSRLDPLAIVIRSGVVSLADVVKAVEDASLIQQNQDGGFMLHVPLIVREKGALIIHNGQTLLMNKSTGVMMPVYGQLHIVDAHILGWDMAQDQPAKYQSPNDFRPYITAWCGSKVNIGNSYLGYLGFGSPKAYGLAYSSCENDKYVAPDTSLKSGTGWIIDNEFEQLYFGFYSHQTENAIILRNKYRDNIVYGIDPHDFSKNLIIAHNDVQGAREKHGIIISRGVSDSYIFNNKTSSNTGSGIMIDRNSTKNVIAFNMATYNGGDGIAFYESPHNVSYRNSYSANKGSGVRVRNSWDVQFYKDVVNDNSQYGFEIYTEALRNRDEDRDPYRLRAGAHLIEPEIISNNAGVFKLSDFDGFKLESAKIYKVKRSLFSGDLKFFPNGYVDANDALYITKR